MPSDLYHAQGHVSFMRRRETRQDLEEHLDFLCAGVDNPRKSLRGYDAVRDGYERLWDAF